MAANAACGYHGENEWRMAEMAAKIA